MATEEPKERLKFYADTKRNKNEYFVWRSHNVDNSLYMLGKYQNNGLVINIRAAYHVFEDGRSMKFTKEQIDWSKKFYNK